MGHYHPAWKQREAEAVEYFDDAFADFTDEPPALFCVIRDEPLELEAGVAGPGSPSWPAVHRYSS
jgi:hypothetical protein